MLTFHPHLPSPPLPDEIWHGGVSETCGEAELRPVCLGGHHLLEKKYFLLVKTYFHVGEEIFFVGESIYSVGEYRWSCISRKERSWDEFLGCNGPYLRNHFWGYQETPPQVEIWFFVKSAVICVLSLINGTTQWFAGVAGDVINPFHFWTTQKEQINCIISPQKCYFRECVIFARNCKFANFVQCNME